ncbi:MAG: L-2-amino-thiazoline-4-carboxylic acid hydrolase [Acidimicrobiales bacterium]
MTAKARPTVEDLPLLERRRIEAMVLVPVIRALQAEFGEEAVNRVVAEAIRGIARAQAAAAPVETMVQLGRRIRGSGPIVEGSLTVEVVEDDEDRFGFDVTHCQFVEMYEALGAGDLGYVLSCNRDAAAYEAMAPGVRFTRTQTRMQGADHCDFRYRPRPA